MFVSLRYLKLLKILFFQLYKRHLLSKSVLKTLRRGDSEKRLKQVRTTLFLDWILIDSNLIKKNLI